MDRRRALARAASGAGPAEAAMIGIDTNILLRWLIAPDEWDIGSSAAEVELVARTILAKDAQFFVNPIVIAETTWILEQKLKLGRGDICDVVDRLLYSENVVIGDADAVDDARKAYEQANIGFADCLIAEINAKAGCDYTLTFDRKAGRRAGFRDIRPRD
jgi:predicted nucleic-acid-binding protein